MRLAANRRVHMANGKANGIVFFGCALLVGLLAAYQFDRFLGIGFTPKQLPVVPTFEASNAERSLPELPPVDAVSVPPGADELYRRAASKLAEALHARTGRLPKLVEGSYPPCAGRVITIGREEKRAAGQGQSGESFSIRSYAEGDCRILAVEGAGRSGDIYGAYRLADELYSFGRDGDIFDLNVSVSPALPYRFVDSGAVGIVPDAGAWGEDYSHHSGVFLDVILPDYPYVNEDAFERVRVELEEYLHRMVSYGYNGVVIDGFLEFVNFDKVGNGLEIYGPNSPFRCRHLRLAERFGGLFLRARNMGMRVVLSTDAPALTKPLEEYFRKRFGGTDVSREELWRVYGLALEELFERFPSIDGIMVRIGEGGGVYNYKGWPYYSSLGVKTVGAAKAMLREFLSVAEKKGRQIYFRNWSIGIGRIGDMHTNLDTYEKLLGDLGSEALIVSTKYGKGDFTCYLPYNPTFRNSRHRRMIEFQARREFEAFSAVPNYLGPFHQAALKDLLEQNSRIEGIWLWSQRGGPVRAGPLSLYPFHGFWPFVDANVYVTGRLSWDAGADLGSLTEIWLRRHFPKDPETVRALGQVFLRSPEAVLKGLYIGEFGRTQVRALGMDVPPNVWVWDIVSGSSSALAAIYIACRNVLDEAVAEGFEAVDIVRGMKDLLLQVKPERSGNPPLLRRILSSLEYEENLLQTLAWYRSAFLHFYRWLDTGKRGAHTEWSQARASFREAKRGHLSTYGKNLDFPGYNFFAADIFTAVASRSPSMAWLARAVVIAALIGLAVGGPACPVLRNLIGPWSALRRPPGPRVGFILPYALITVGLLVFSSFLSPRFPLWAMLSLAAFICPLWVFHRNTPAARASLQAAAAGPLLVLLALVMTVVSIRGPLYFWYMFWASPLFRVLGLGLGIACVLWMFSALYAVSRHLGMAPLSAIGMLSVSVGGVLLFNGLTAGVIGLEAFATGLNSDLSILPLSLSKILGITTHLNIDPGLPRSAGAGGAALVLGGWMLHRLATRGKAG